jgi:hypothetical protein
MSVYWKVDETCLEINQLVQKGIISISGKLTAAIYYVEGDPKKAVEI